MKIHPMEAELLHVVGYTDGQSDITNLIVVFCNFANAPKIMSAFNEENIFHGNDQVELNTVLFLINVCILHRYPVYLAGKINLTTMSVLLY